MPKMKKRPNIYIYLALYTFIYYILISKLAISIKKLISYSLNL